MACFKWLQRFRQSRGYGVHSPFAFELIQKVLSSRAHYYAFDEIADRLAVNHPDIPLNDSLNRLSFRMVCHFNSREVLEIHSGYGVNSLFLLSPDSHIRCTCVDKRSERIELARELTAARTNQVAFLTELPVQGVFDAIVIHPIMEPFPSFELLLQLSHENTFWIIDQVNTPRCKQFWDKIVNDERIGMTFDMKNIGVVFLRHTYSKLHYFI